MKNLLALLSVLAWAYPSFATVPDVPYTVTYTCSGGYGPFAFGYPVSDPTALSVTLNGTLLGSADYTVIPVNNNYNNGGSVTLGAGFPCSTGTLVIARVTPITQTVLFYDNMPVPNSTFGRGLDKVTEIEQELNGLIDAIGGGGNTPSSTIYLAGVDSGSSGTNFALALAGLNSNSNKCPTVLADGVTASFIPLHTNSSSTTPTFQLCGLSSAATIVKKGTSGEVALVDNDIISGSTAYVAQVVYNATTGHWLLTDPATGSQPLTGFSNITTGTNTTATMTVGSGAEITVTGAGINNANEINGVSLGSLASCIIFNTTSTGILSCLTVGSGLSLSGSTLTATGSGGSPVYDLVTGNYTVPASDFNSPSPACGVINPTTTLTLTLTASGSQPAAGKCIHILPNTHSIGLVTIAPNGQSLFFSDGSSGSALLTTTQDAWIVSDGTNFYLSYDKVNNDGNNIIITDPASNTIASGNNNVWIGRGYPAPPSGTNTVVGAAAGNANMGPADTLIGEATGQNLNGDGGNIAIGFHAGITHLGSSGGSENIVIGFSNLFSGPADTPTGTTNNYINIEDWLTGDTLKGIVTWIGPTTTLGSCGSSSLASGSNDTAGEVSIASGVTSCVVNFANTHNVAPFCVVTDQGAVAVTYSISTTALTVSSASLASHSFDYHCFAGSNSANPVQ